MASPQRPHTFNDDPRTIIQNAWVVPDVQKAMQKWLGLGYGPFLTFNLKLSDALYRGKTSPFEVSVGLAQAGNVQVELIEQLSDGPSAYRDMYGLGEGGFHHVCKISADYERDIANLRRNGIALATEGELDGFRFCYADTREQMGCMVELLPESSMIQTIYQTVLAAAAGWDGRDPIRPLF